MTSTNASFLRYLTSDRRQLVLPVAWIVILDESSRCRPFRNREQYEQFHLLLNKRAWY